MRSLGQRLETLKNAMASKIDADSREIMKRSTQSLIDEKRADGALGEGDRIPGFRLPRADGAVVASDDWLAKGPLVITFFRGHW